MGSPSPLPAAADLVVQLREIAREQTRTAFLLGARTERRPDQSHLDLLDEIIATLASRLETIDRDPGTLRAAGLRLARSIDVNAVMPLVSPTVAELRPRERAILELYAEGLAT